MHVSYPICAGSGDLGPKRERGDGQVPEGLYEIDRFNPTSRYHLSLRVNYPNLSDRLRRCVAALAQGQRLLQGLPAAGPPGSAVRPLARPTSSLARPRFQYKASGIRV